MSARIVVASVAARLPAWAEDACAEYLKRLPRGYQTARVQVKPESRTQGKSVAQLLEAEATRLTAALPRQAIRIALDERGKDLDTAAFSIRLRDWLDRGLPLALLIGGPDGLDERLRKSCTAALRLSSLTLPHALAQVLVCEQIYRAATLEADHPYHRA